MAISRRTIAMLVTLPALCLLITANAYLFTSNLKRVDESTSRRTNALATQTAITNVMRGLDEMEASQRGYLLTADPSYLQLYTEARARFERDLSQLRSRLTIEPQLEAVTKSRIADLEHGIRLRQQGYRRRAFQLVHSNDGKKLMDEAREMLNGLWSKQGRVIAQHEAELAADWRRTYSQTVAATVMMLFAVAATLLAFNTHGRRLAQRCARQTEQLRTTSAEVERFSSALSQDFRALVINTRADSSALLYSAGGFLPRQGQEQAERIHDAAERMNSVLDELLEQQSSEPSVALLEVETPEKLTA